MASNYVHKSLLKHVAKERDDAREERDAALGEALELQNIRASLLAEISDLEDALSEARVP